MRFRALSSLLLIASAISAHASPHVRRGPTAPRITRAHAKASKSTVSHVGMSSERATQIQTALIKAGYLSGTPSGTWDASSQAAMEKLQADNGWPTKFVPDARAIIKLGLGPSSTGATPSTEAAPNNETATTRPSNPSH